MLAAESIFEAIENEASSETKGIDEFNEYRAIRDLNLS